MSDALASALDAYWQQAVESVRLAAIRVWSIPSMGHSVDHGPKHAERVVRLLDGLTEGLMHRPERLCSQEIYVLLAATYLHAIGLQDEKAEPDATARWAHYPELGAALVYRTVEDEKAALDLGLVDDDSLLELVARVVARHRDTSFPSPDYDELQLGDVRTRPRLLTALLCLGDALDITYQRVDIEQLKLMHMSEDMALDWWLHHYVGGVRVQDEYVHIDYRVPRDNSAYADSLPLLVEQQVRARFDALRDTLRLYGVKIDIAPQCLPREMRAVKPMPPSTWRAAQNRLATAQSQANSQGDSLALPLIETVRNLLSAMDYDCEPLDCVDGPLVCFRCNPKSGGLRPSLLAGVKNGPIEASDVRALAAQLTAQYWRGYLVAESRIMSSARREAREHQRVGLFTIGELYRELLDFRPYVQALIDGYEQNDLARHYVDLRAVRYSYDREGRGVAEDPEPIDSFVTEWLKDRSLSPNLMPILGDFGTGKTSFCQHYAALQGRRWLLDPDRERIPILIDLRNYTKTPQLSGIVTDLLVNQHRIQGATFDAFMRYNTDGKLLVLFDGLDEMGHRGHKNSALENLHELWKVLCPRSKVIVTSRTEYFSTELEAQGTLRGAVSPGIAPYLTFDIVYLQPFDDKQVQAALQRRLPGDWPSAIEQMQLVYNLWDLAHRPVLLDMIARAFPWSTSSMPVTLAKLYELYTNQWLERDAMTGRALLAPADRRFFAEQLACQMFKADRPVIHHTEIPDQIRQHFQLLDSEDLDWFEEDVRSCDFLSRDAKGYYAFAHKSIMEYFVACNLHSQMMRDEATKDGPISITEEVRGFLSAIFALKPKKEASPPYPPPDGFVWVPPGEFIRGAFCGQIRGDRAWGRGSALELQVVRLEEGFFAARALVTNAQYARFATAVGLNAGELPKDFAHLMETRPDHPVVYVLSADAEDYARHVGGRLMTEEEWEKAARGYDGRAYPWGEWAPNRCNTAEAGRGGTSPVGSFSPVGDSPYGLHDTAGNVWEYTSSVFEEPSHPVLRGGAYFEGRDLALCAFRSGNWATYTNWQGIGFRIALSVRSINP